MATESTPDVDLTRQDVANLRRVSVRQVDRWIKDGRLQAEWIGRQVRISVDALAEFDANERKATRPGVEAAA